MMQTWVTSIRTATEDDADLIGNLILELAKFEKLRHEAKPNVKLLRRDLAKEANPRIHALIAQCGGEPVGFALYFFRYSTFLTNWGIYLEDIYLREAYRGTGLGKMLLGALAMIAVEGGHERLDLSVLDWNTKAIEFYERLGARPIIDWISMRFESDALKKINLVK